MSVIQKRRKELRTELSMIEKQIYDLETTYLEESRDFGNIFQGWDAYLSQDKIKPKKSVQNDERLFSLSSVTSPASRKEEKEKATKEAGAEKGSNGNKKDGSSSPRNGGGASTRAVVGDVSVNDADGGSGDTSGNGNDIIMKTSAVGDKRKADDEGSGIEVEF